MSETGIRICTSDNVRRKKCRLLTPRTFIEWVLGEDEDAQILGALRFISFMTPTKSLNSTLVPSSTKPGWISKNHFNQKSPRIPGLQASQLMKKCKNWVQESLATWPTALEQQNERILASWTSVSQLKSEAPPTPPPAQASSKVDRGIPEEGNSIPWETLGIRVQTSEMSRQWLVSPMRPPLRKITLLCVPRIRLSLTLTSWVRFHHLPGKCSRYFLGTAVFWSSHKQLPGAVPQNCPGPALAIFDSLSSDIPYS